MTVPYRRLVLVLGFHACGIVAQEAGDVVAFPGSLTIGDTADAAYTNAGWHIRSDRLMVGSNGWSGVYYQSSGSFTGTSAAVTSHIGYEGGTGTLHLAGGTAYFPANQLWLSGNIMGHREPRPFGSMILSNATVECNDLHIGRDWSNNGTGTAMLAAEMRLQAGSLLMLKTLGKYDDPRATVYFDGGRIQARQSGIDLVYIQGRGDIRLVASAGHDIDIDTMSFVNLALARFSGSPSAKLILEGDGGFRKRGTGNLRFFGDEVSYAGDTLVADGMLRLGAPYVLPHGAGKGNLIVEGPCSVVDLNGYDTRVNRLSGWGSITNASCTNVVLGVLADGSSDHWEHAWISKNISLEKLGTGTLSVRRKGSIPTNCTISAGTLLVAQNTVYPFYRLKLEDVRTLTEHGVQLAELALYDGVTDVTGLRTNLAYDTTCDPGMNAFPPNETPEKVVDGSLDTKWLDWRLGTERSPIYRDNVWVRLDFAEPQKITHYTWATANDDPRRDPSAWRMQGSTNATDWIDLDCHARFLAPNDRKTWVSTSGFALDLGANDAIDDTAQVQIKTGGTLLVQSASETIGGITGAGSVVIDGATLTLNTAEGVTAEYDGLICGDGTLVKDGTGTQTLNGTNAIQGSVVVQGGVLALDPQVRTPFTWFRFTVKETRSAGATVMQFAELALYDSLGVRQNLNLSAGTAPDALQPGQWATPAAYPGSSSEHAGKLFDGDMAATSKWCPNNNDIKPDDAATWRTVVMRLAGSPEIVAYNLATATEAINIRDPYIWLMEGSVDGVNWVTLDEKSGVTTDTRGWYNNDQAYSFTQAAANIETTDDDCFLPGTSIDVGPGAMLTVVGGNETVDSLRIDTAGAGTLSGVTLAAHGLLDLHTALDDLSGQVLPLTLTGVSNCGALRAWTVYVNGVREPSYSVFYDEATGVLRVSRKGLCITIL
ncbi:MAG TPA: autotransporter-associated beta strand repeat-containing protein [Candidatus Latescibacteria bacterium]|nr:autotransporter-associated beta strand repeat-containing protein [Candidatus Latescibacterota bacterium]